LSDTIIEFKSITFKTGNSGTTTSVDGVYRVPLGALAAYNTSGDFYTYDDDVKKLFSDNSDLKKRVENGYMKSEYNHPDVSGLGRTEMFKRILAIDVDKVCCTIVALYITPKQVNGRTEYIIDGDIVPSGPYGEILKEELDNKHLNVAFSIRALTKNVTNADGTLTKKLLHAITFDYVSQCGIPSANTHSSLESDVARSIDPDTLKDILVDMKSDAVSVEDNRQVNVILESIKRVNVKKSCIYDGARI